MMKRKRTHWWPRPWEYREAEAWLADMAAKGWALESLGFVYARFVKAEPAALQYRCVQYGFLEDQGAMQKAYEDAGWKCIGFIKSQMVFSMDASNETPLDPANPDKQEQLVRKRIWSKVIWFLVSLVIYAAGLCVLYINPDICLNIAMKNQFPQLFISLWFIIYWLIFLCDIASYLNVHRGGGKLRVGYRHARVSSALLIVRVVLVVLLLPGPRNLIMLLEEHSAQPVVSASAMLEAVQSPYTIFPDELGRAKEGYGVLIPYHKIEYGFAGLSARGETGELSGLLNYTVARYDTWSVSAARSLAEKLSQLNSYADSFFPLEESVPSVADTMGFDWLWMGDFDRDHIVVAVMGKSVVYIHASEVRNQLRSDQLLAFLRQKDNPIWDK